MTTGVILMGLAIIVAFFWGVGQAILKKNKPDRSGWLYFISNGKGSPVKVGLSRYDPSGQRLAELRTMSPTPLRVLYKVPVDDRYAAERVVHEHLAPYRQHGEWFDRDATLAFIEHLKGAY